MCAVAMALDVNTRSRCRRYRYHRADTLAVRITTISCMAVYRAVVVNFDLGNGFRDLGPSNAGVGQKYRVLVRAAYRRRLASTKDRSV